ncbi:MAG TPA: MFS transporter [Nonomuraea sp.]|nr:MFS transporter [Nonomuraea sp.]
MGFPVGAVVLAAGVAASMALGQFIPFLAAVGKEFALPLTAVGWLSSLVTLLAGLACLPLGIWLEGRRLRAYFLAALLVLAAAGLGAAVADGAAVLFAVRVIQGAGYALVVIIGPSLLARLLTGKARQSALALWGLCVPAGLTLATAGAALATTAGWRGQAAGTGVITLAVAVMAVTLPVDTRSGRRERADQASGTGVGWTVAAAAAGFALIASIGVSVVTVLPAYLAAEAGLSSTRSSLLTAVVSAASVLGSLAAGAALRSGARPARLVAAALLMAPLSAGTFTLMPTPVAVVAGCAAAVLVLNGLAVSALFAALPAVAGDRIAVAVAALTQAGSLDTLLGPPLYAKAVDTMGWGAAVAVTAAIAGAGVGCALAALRGRQPARSNPP